MVGVSAPGPVDVGDRKPQRSASAARGTRRASAISSDATSRSSDEHAGGGDDEDRRDAAVVGQFDCDQRERRDDQHGGDRIGPARPALDARDRVAKQRRDRHVVGAPERPEREGQRGQQAIEHASARPAGLIAGASGSGRIEPKPQAMTNGSAAPSDEPGHRADRGERMTCTR